MQVKLGQPGPYELGFVDSISVEEIGGARVSYCSLSWIQNLLVSWIQLFLTIGYIKGPMLRVL